MKFCLFLTIALLAATRVTAQSAEQIAGYFNQDWEAVTDPKTAAFYKTVEQKDSIYLVRNYYISGKKQRYAEYLDEALETAHGKMLRYYESGALKEEERWDHGKRVGTQKTYYENGSLQKESRTAALGAEEVFIHYFSKDGHELLPNGKGVINVEINEPGFDVYEEVKDSVTVFAYKVSQITGDTTSVALEKPAEYKGGIKAMSRHIQGRLTYPKEARRKRVSGSVFVSFVIDKKGNVTDVKVVKGVHPALDAVAVAAIASMKPWIPGERLGQVTKSRFVLPIYFRLP
ncbi:TonB family C-terminal domain-containing protein [Chryseolinea serpens]|uniref:TonB family C-terminal domain-containing protein n=1 Tax=Chryseolinea serpens TaxID=947013 RepID=A0A1M5K5S1_9BACT|nr:energy transducer TonB [Chryseolinea serpens]SHG48192.1 TonB family C-terminal domain-containing protein [Chryseolinea serpens]